MARIAGVNVPSNKRLVIALSYIFGIGNKFSNDICTTVQIDKNKRVNSLTEDEIIKIRECIDKNYIVEGVTLDEAQDYLIGFEKPSDISNFNLISNFFPGTLINILN